jgi:Amt family ammonium transporter
MNNADIAWMLVATALVLLMTPALGFFYGGMVRSKNALNTMMMSFVSLGPVAAVWALVGYSLAFAPGTPLVGGLAYAGLGGVGLEAQGTIPHLLFMAFQGTFAIITAALISGAIVERMRFSAYLTFILAWVVAVYAPVAHWVWGGGFLAGAGALDFAGGAVVHVNAASAALVAAVVVGPRKDYGRHAILPHNVPFTLLGAGLLWFGWFGFNAGSALAATPARRCVRQHAARPRGHAGSVDFDPAARRVTAIGGATAIVVGLVVSPGGRLRGAGSAWRWRAGRVPSYFALILRTHPPTTRRRRRRSRRGRATGAILTGVRDAAWSGGAAARSRAIRQVVVQATASCRPRL